MCWDVGGGKVDQAIDLPVLDCLHHTCTNIQAITFRQSLKESKSKSNSTKVTKSNLAMTWL